MTVEVMTTWRSFTDSCVQRQHTTQGTVLHCMTFDVDT